MGDKPWREGAGGEAAGDDAAGGDGTGDVGPVGCPPQYREIAARVREVVKLTER